MSEPLESALAIIAGLAPRPDDYCRIYGREAAALLAEIERLLRARLHELEFRTDLEALRREIPMLRARPTREQALRAIRWYYGAGYEYLTTPEDCLDAAMREQP